MLLTRLLQIEKGEKHGTVVGFTEELNDELKAIQIAGGYVMHCHFDSDETHWRAFILYNDAGRDGGNKPRQDRTSDVLGIGTAPKRYRCHEMVCNCECINCRAFSKHHFGRDAS